MSHQELLKQTLLKRRSAVYASPNNSGIIHGLNLTSSIVPESDQSTTSDEEWDIAFAEKQSATSTETAKPTQPVINTGMTGQTGMQPLKTMKPVKTEELKVPLTEFEQAQVNMAEKKKKREADAAAKAAKENEYDDMV